jgi:hypothetical protein
VSSTARASRTWALMLGFRVCRLVGVSALSHAGGASGAGGPCPSHVGAGWAGRRAPRAWARRVCPPVRGWPDVGGRGPHPPPAQGASRPRGTAAGDTVQRAPRGGLLTGLAVVPRAPAACRWRVGSPARSPVIASCTWPWARRGPGWAVVARGRAWAVVGCGRVSMSRAQARVRVREVGPAGGGGRAGRRGTPAALRGRSRT